MHLVVLTQVLDRQDAVLGFFHTWCHLFARHVTRLTVVAQQVGQVDLPDNATVVSLGRERGAGRLGMWWRLTRTLHRLKGKDAPDAILAHMVPRFALSAAPQARARGIPLYLWYTHKGVDRSLRMAVTLVKKGFTASAESFRLETEETEVVVTGHGVDARHFHFGDDPRPVDVVAVGRLSPTKGQDELVEALARLDPVPVTEIAGDVLLEQDVPWREALRRRADEVGAGRITLLGAVPNPAVADVLRRARVLVSTSRTGSVDKAVLEAMATGTLPLTCNESFGPIFGPDLASRLMYAPGDLDQLVTRLDALLALPADEAELLGRRLRTKVLVDHDVLDLIPRLVSGMRPAGRVAAARA